MADSEPTTISPQPEPEGEATPNKMVRQQHMSNLLDDVLIDAEIADAEMQTAKHGNKHPFAIDLFLGIGLLFAMAGFTLGLMRMYVAHSAETYITQGNYKAAIALLEGSKFPDFLTAPGSDPIELLNKAYYLDAMRKLDAYSEDEVAIRELSKIMPDSKFFEFSQEILKDHFKPAALTLEGGASQSVQMSEQNKAVTPAPPSEDAESTQR